MLKTYSKIVDSHLIIAKWKFLKTLLDCVFWPLFLIKFDLFFAMQTDRILHTLSCCFSKIKQTHNVFTKSERCFEYAKTPNSAFGIFYIIKGCYSPCRRFLQKAYNWGSWIITRFLWIWSQKKGIRNWGIDLLVA